MKKSITAACVGALVVVAGAAAAAAPKAPASGPIRRGQYLVTLGGCNDCHTPWKMGPNGPENDRTRLLSGHPQDLPISPAPKLPPPWGASATGTFTGWAGPWGVSFASNLTPDAETGLGKWTEQNFVEAMRKGRHMGRGRPILPPMPWQSIRQLTDGDLKAMYAYLRSIPPISDRVPDPTPPESGVTAEGGGGTAPPPAR